jgi:aspartate aminotransferase
MRIGHHASSIEASPTLALNDKAKALRSQGKPVINLGVGEPKNPAPMSAIEYAQQCLGTRDLKYTPASGIQEFKQAVVDYTAKHYGRTPKLNNVLVTVGAKQAIYNALVAILDPGDEVILLAPYWVSYPEMVRLPAGIPVPVAPPIGQLQQRIEDIEQAVTERTRAILLNSPNNPTGVVYTQDFIKSLVEFCEAREIYLILDDIYHQLVYGDTPWVSGYQFTNREIDESYLVVINGVSKTYGMTGLRIGWAVGTAELIKVMSNIQSQTTSGTSILTQEAALGALVGPQNDVDDLRAFIKENRDLVLKGLATLEGVTCIEPGGAFYCFPDFSAYDKDSMALAGFLLEKALVAVVPGAPFGLDGHLRISFAGDRQGIMEAIQRIHWALDPNSSAEIAIGAQKFVRDWV